MVKIKKIKYKKALILTLTKKKRLDRYGSERLATTSHFIPLYLINLLRSNL